MKEDLLHFLWERRYFPRSNLRTTQGVEVEIHHWGSYNSHDGPDFLGARITIGDTMWAGNVEMHLQASDWLRHGHSTDPRYDNVILHVVLEEDRPVFNAGGARIPCIEMRSLIPPDMSGRYLKLLATTDWVPCQVHLDGIPLIVKSKLLESRLVERLESRTTDLLKLVIEQKQDWEETLYRAMAKSFGFKINGEAMFDLTRRIPLKILRKAGDNREEVEALLFGTAGMLNRIFADSYPARLQQRYTHLVRKYNLQPMSETRWRWKQSRPANFPTIRLSQFADFLVGNTHLLSNLLECTTLEETRKLFVCRVSPYFTEHYQFDRKTAPRPKMLGAASIDRILINTVLPFLFLYARQRDMPDLSERVLEHFEQIKPERNNITSRWEKLGMPNTNAGQSQGLIQLKNNHCNKQLCLRCAIGSRILAAPGSDIQAAQDHV